MKRNLNKIFTAIIFCIASLFFSQNGFSQITASFIVGGSNMQCLGNTVSFIDQSTGNPVSWNWSFPTGMPTTSTQQNPVVILNIPGIFDATLIVTDAGGNSDTLTIQGVINVDFFMVTETHVDALCGSNIGSITTTVTGGFAPYNYSWNAGYTTPNLTNLTAGTYTLVVVDAMGCMQQITVVIQSLGIFSLGESHWDATCGNNDGLIDLTNQGGVSPFTYTWSNGATTEDQSNLSAGIYDVTVTDSFGCFNSTTIIIGNINGPTLTSSSLSSTCGNSNGSIDLVPSGGVPPYTYLWSNGATTEDISSLSAGFYNVTVSDQNSCQGFASIAVSDSNLLAVTSVMTNPSCGNSGNISLTLNGGTLPYTYLWSNGSTSNSLTNVQAGVYIVTVTEATGCSLIQNFNATFYSYVYMNSTTPNCSNNGAITATPMGVNAPYTYLWNNSEITQTITGLAPGNYSVTVTDSAGCVTTGQTFLSTSCNNIIEGIAFNDLNSNCIQDSGEVAVQGIVLTASNGFANYFAYTNYDGYYQIPIGSSGNFTLTASNNNLICGNLYACTATSQVFFPAVGDTSSNNNFGFVTTGANFDLRLHPGWSSANPGFDKHFWILYFNASPISFNDTATVVFTYDPNLIYFDSIAPFPVHDLANHTLTWEVANVPNPIYNWPDRLHAFFHTPASLPVGTLIQSDFDIYPTIDDCNASNNHQHYSETLTGSLDPNSKEVYLEGNIQDDSSVLYYTINFQNTGNDTTNFILLKDTLSLNLDPTTVENISSSHPYQSFDISGTGILTWVFNPILLVDSTTNEPESKGFVKFKIKRRPNLPYGTYIYNTASIYFDYNSAVVTNTVNTHLVWFSVNNISNENIFVSAYPNPSTNETSIKVNGVNEKFDFSLSNVLGKKVMELNSISNQQFTFERKGLPSGIYFFTISVKGKSVANGKIVID